MEVFAGRGGSQSRSMASQPQHFPNLLHSDPGIPTSHHDVDDEMISRHSSASTNSPNYPVSAEASPFVMSPWNQTTASPYSRSTWTRVPTMPANYVNPFPAGNGDGGEQIEIPATGLVGSLVREEGHIYSLAAAGDLLYTGSDSKNIRVWKDRKEFSGFKSSSGLVKAIVISGERIYTGHQDGKIRVWRVSSRNSSSYKRVGTLPTMKDFLKSSMNPSNYVEVRRRRNSLWIKHFDAISCLNLNEDGTLLYSGSWDKTLKVWRVSDSKCLESITAHDDAVNSVVVGLGGYVFTGSADGTVKAWHREGQGKSIRHPLVQTLLRQECAVTALAISCSASILYCGSSDGLVNFWERDKMMSHGGVLRGHRLAVLCLAAAGCLVFSGSADKSICVWKREEGATHTCLSVLNGHTGPVKCIAVDTDKEAPAYDKRWTVYSGSLDKSVKVWKVSELVPDVQLPDDGCPQRRQYEYAPSPVDTEDSLSRRG